MDEIADSQTEKPLEESSSSQSIITSENEPIDTEIISTTEVEETILEESVDIEFDSIVDDAAFPEISGNVDFDILGNVQAVTKSNNSTSPLPVISLDIPKVDTSVFEPESKDSTTADSNKCVKVMKMENSVSMEKVEAQPFEQTSENAANLEIKLKPEDQTNIFKETPSSIKLDASDKKEKIEKTSSYNEVSAIINNKEMTTTTPGKINIKEIVYINETSVSARMSEGYNTNIKNLASSKGSTKNLVLLSDKELERIKNIPIPKDYVPPPKRKKIVLTERAPPPTALNKGIILTKVDPKSPALLQFKKQKSLAIMKKVQTPVKLLPKSTNKPSMNFKKQKPPHNPQPTNTELPEDITTNDQILPPAPVIPKIVNRPNITAGCVHYLKTVVSNKLKLMDSEQKLLAENMINEILKKGLFNQLKSTYTVMPGIVKIPEQVDVDGKVLIIKKQKNNWTLMKCGGRSDEGRFVYRMFVYASGCQTYLAYHYLFRKGKLLSAPWKSTFV